MAVIASGCDTPPASTSARAEAPSTPAVPQVVTVSPERADLRRYTREPGQIDAFETTAMHAKLAGYVQSLSVDIGDRITKGQVLAELFAPEVEAERDQKKALVEQAKAEHHQAESAVEVAEAAVTSAQSSVTEARASIRRTEADVARWQSEYDRIDQLVRERATTSMLLDETRSKLESSRASQDEVRARLTSAESALVESRAELDKARSDVKAAQAHIAVAEADARRAEALADYARILAPFDGVVIEREVDTGHLTVPGGSSDPLFVVARTDKVRIAVGVPEVDAPLIDPGDPAEVQLQALDGRVFTGAVSRISWALDPTTRTLLAEIDLDNPDGLLRPGLYAYSSILAAERTDVLTIPLSALVRDGGKTFCVSVSNGQAHRQEVVTGLSDGQRIEIVSGLQPDDTIVLTNADTLTDGQPVAPEPGK